jgi:hypothetical protein
MGGLHESTAIENMLYGYGENGKTKKRTLEQPDITGIQEQYGE